ncbi:hypothetical protein BMF94_0399, partial [Rhodotorula taiwanensis]
MWRLSLALLAAASAVTAQQTVNPNVPGYGQISCTNYDGTPNYASAPTTGTLPALSSGNYFCGILGSQCSYAKPCDGSVCNGVESGNGHCGGGYSYGGYCAGSLQTSPNDYICGGIDDAGGAGCNDNYDCISNYCDPIGKTCRPTGGNGDSCSSSVNNGRCGFNLQCDPASETCVPVPATTAGSLCYVDPSQCSSSLYCGDQSRCHPRLPFDSDCSAYPDSCQAGYFCTAEDRTCQPQGSYEYASCSSTYANQCVSPLYCSGSTAAPGYTQKCLSKVAVGRSCVRDPVDGCVAGAYCTLNGQSVCAAEVTTVGGSCAFDPVGACGFDSQGDQLYCVSSTQQCQKRATAVGDSCAFDTVSGCGVDGNGAVLYCDTSAAGGPVCAEQLNSIGAVCRSNPLSACGVETAQDGTTTPLYCSLPSYTCAARLSLGDSCTSNPAAACIDPLYCSSNTQVCIEKQNSFLGLCNADPYAQCGIDPSAIAQGRPGQLYPDVEVNSKGDQICQCLSSPSRPASTPLLGAFGLGEGQDCSADPKFSCGYSTSGVKLYCALPTSTCQTHVTTVGGSCAYDYLGACGKTAASNGDYVQLYPSIPAGSTGHAACTCVLQADVVVRPSSRARARARARRNLSLCPESHTACPVGKGFECIDTTSNIEQCGGCSGDSDSVDCSALEGVAAV